VIDQRGRFERAFEVFQMPEPALERMLGRHERRQRARRVSTGGLALVIAVVAIVVVVRAFGTGQQTGRSPSPSVVDLRAYLTRILPPEASEPGGLPFTSTSAGVSAVTRPLQGSPLSASQAVQVSFVDAMVFEFSIGEDPFLGTFAAAYEDEAAAEAALRVFLSRFQQDYDYLDAPTNPGLGPDSYLFRESTGPTTTLLWRRGELILNVHGFGAIAPDVVLGVGRGMDSRVEREGGV
jgi:hypothetical protein